MWEEKQVGTASLGRPSPLIPTHEGLGKPIQSNMGPLLRSPLFAEILELQETLIRNHENYNFPVYSR